MQTPIISFFNAFTNELVERQMTDEEYAELLASGWTEEAPVVEEPATEEETVKESIVVAEEPVDDEES
jgi:hypothetical protein